MSPARRRRRPRSASRPSTRSPRCPIPPSPPSLDMRSAHGLTLALAADWRVSGDNVKFGATEILAGLAPDRRRRDPAGRRGRGEQGQGPGVQRTFRRRPRSARAGADRRDGGTGRGIRRGGHLGEQVSGVPAGGAGGSEGLRSGNGRRHVRLPCMTSSDVTDPAPTPHATKEQVEAARHDTKLAQVLYHDWEAETYDDKWSISYDQRCIDYARGRFDAIVPEEVQRELPYDRALELGCGTGFFLLNLIQAGVARRGSVTDLSPGHGQGRHPQRPVTRARHRRPGRRRRGHPVRRQHVRSGRRARRAAPHPRCRAVPARSRPGAQARRPVRLRRRAHHRRQRVRPQARRSDMEDDRGRR